MCRAFQLHVVATKALAHDADLLSLSAVVQADPAAGAATAVKHVKDKQTPRRRDIAAPGELTVAKWETKESFQCDRPEVNMWLVRCSADLTAGRVRKAWARGGVSGDASRELHALLNVRNPANDYSGGTGFVRGQALHEDKVATLRTCSGADLPRYLFRVTHDGTADGTTEPIPHRGLRARGHGHVRTDPVHFQNLVQLHLNWNWRGRSPFVSVAVTPELANLFGAVYASRGCRNVRVYVVDTRVLASLGGDVCRVFRVAHLVAQLGLRFRPAYVAEYLVENEIPRESVVCTVADWARVPPRWARYAGLREDRRRWQRYRRLILKAMEALMGERREREARPREAVVLRKWRSVGFTKVRFE